MIRTVSVVVFGEAGGQGPTQRVRQQRGDQAHAGHAKEGRPGPRTRTASRRQRRGGSRSLVRSWRRPVDVMLSPLLELPAHPKAEGKKANSNDGTPRPKA